VRGKKSHEGKQAETDEKRKENRKKTPNVISTVKVKPQHRRDVKKKKTMYTDRKTATEAWIGPAPVCFSSKGDAVQAQRQEGRGIFWERTKAP